MGKRNKTALIIGFIALLYICTNREYNGVIIYKNVFVEGRSLSKEGYNFGKKWQCVEFVKRYYYEQYSHIMPNSYGHAKDFFNNQLKNGEYNRERGLYQFYNGNIGKGDILVLSSTKSNNYGHIAIVDRTVGDYLVVYQQNTFSHISIINKKNKRILGWLKAPVK